jgi:hypothetical protein
MTFAPRCAVDELGASAGDDSDRYGAAPAASRPGSSRRAASIARPGDNGARQARPSARLNAVGVRGPMTASAVWSMSATVEPATGLFDGARRPSHPMSGSRHAGRTFTHEPRASSPTVALLLEDPLVTAALHRAGVRAESPVEAVATQPDERAAATPRMRRDPRRTRRSRRRAPILAVGMVVAVASVVLAGPPSQRSDRPLSAADASSAADQRGAVRVVRPRAHVRRTARARERRERRDRTARARPHGRRDRSFRRAPASRAVATAPTRTRSAEGLDPAPAVAAPEQTLRSAEDLDPVPTVAPPQPAPRAGGRHPAPATFASEFAP